MNPSSTSKGGLELRNQVSKTSAVPPKLLDNKKSVEVGSTVAMISGDGFGPEGEVEKKKKKKKKLPKAERQRRKEEEKMKSIYGPKDSHVQLISASTLQKLNSAHSSQISRSSFLSSTSHFESRSVAFSAEDFPSFTPTQSSVTLDSKGPYNRTLLLHAEFPSLGSTPLDTNKSVETSVSRGPASVHFSESKTPSKPNCQKTSSTPVESKPPIPISLVLKTDSGPKSDDNAQKTELKSKNRVCTTASSGIGSVDTSETKPKSEPIILGASDVPSGSNKKKSKKPLIISIDALIAKKKPVAKSVTKANKKLRDLKSSAAAKSEKQTLGNILDSSGPMVIHRGKIREKPKKKKLTRLKKAILVSRLNRAESQKSPPVNNSRIPNVLEEHNSSINTDAKQGKPSTDDILKLQESTVTSAGDFQTDEHKVNVKDSKHVSSERSEIVVQNDSFSSPCSPVSAKELLPKSNQEVPEGDAKTCRKGKGSENENILTTLLNAVIKEQAEQGMNRDAKLDKSIMAESIITVTPKKDEVSPEIYMQAKKLLHNRKFRPYCDMYTSKELHGHVINLMKELHRFQDRLYHTDPIKFKSKRRYVHGLKDAFTYLQLNKVVLVILAPDMEANHEKGGLDEKIQEIKAKAMENKVPVVFSGNRYILGKPCFIKSQVSAIAILDKQGAEELYRAVIDESSKLRTKYEQDFHEKIQQALAST